MLCYKIGKYIGKQILETERDIGIGGQSNIGTGQISVKNIENIGTGFRKTISVGL